MLRRRSTATGLPLLLVLLAGCAGSQEASILEEFFEASRLYDSVTLGSLATTAFDPQADGIVQSFRVTGVGPERRGPAPSADRDRRPPPADGLSVAERSLVRVGPLVAAAVRLNAEVVSKDVIVDALVRTPEGELEERTLTATLTRVRATTGDGTEVEGRWIVTGIGRREGPRES
jgi:hypothetical protein